jgi:hypothetical protein
MMEVRDFHISTGSMLLVVGEGGHRRHQQDAGNEAFHKRGRSGGGR